MPIINVQNVTKHFGRIAALANLSCSVEQGNVVGLLGPNGSGKTSLIRLLCAFFPPTSGIVTVDGYDTRLSPLDVRRRVGYALEGVVLYPDLTVRDFLAFVRTVKKADRKQCEAMIIQCGLDGWLDRRIGTLSKGYRQRVVLAQALIGDPPVLILDEPTAGMDPEMAVHTRELLTSLAGTKTVLLSTHSLAEAARVCENVLVLHQGQILAQGSPQAVFPRQDVNSTFEDEFVRLLRAQRGPAVLPAAGSFG
jgi:gliding motility-associated transport system ATP-binding protein